MPGPRKLLVTGAAGFIGFHVANALLRRGDMVIGLDNVNSYYDPKLKRDRLALLNATPGFTFVEADIADPGTFDELPDDVTGVIHLAAQAGGRHSYEHPEEFIPSNLVGFYNAAAFAVARKVGHFVFASTSSVYGPGPERPSTEAMAANHPLSLYAATKKSNEAMAHALSHINGLPVTGLRFFTVYGPWGRPDMSFFRFAKAIIAGEPIDLHNHGQMTRDFTFVDDIVAGVLAAYNKPPQVDAAWADAPLSGTSGAAPYRIFNIGSGRPVDLATYVAAFERAIGKKAITRNVSMHPGEALDTHADASALAAWTGVSPTTSLDDGVARFVVWYRDYHSV